MQKIFSTLITGILFKKTVEQDLLTINGTVTITASYNDSTDNVKVIVKNLESELTVSQLYSDDSDIELFTSSSTLIETLFICI